VHRIVHPRLEGIVAPFLARERVAVLAHVEEEGGADD
jgi:predicted N-acyltransferase